MEVKVNQVWRDKDRRNSERKVKVIAVFEQKARVQTVEGQHASMRRTSLVRLSRLTTKFELVRAPEVGA